MESFLQFVGEHLGALIYLLVIVVSVGGLLIFSLKRPNVARGSQDEISALERRLEAKFEEELTRARVEILRDIDTRVFGYTGGTFGDEPVEDEFGATEGLVAGCLPTAADKVSH